MDKIIRLKSDASLFIVSSGHVVCTTGSLFSDYGLRVSECDYVCDDNRKSPSNNEIKI
jgi:hypothetical protein